jgi:hypothetical protein
MAKLSNQADVSLAICSFTLHLGQALNVVGGAIMISGTYLYLAIVIFSIGTVAAYVLPLP